MKLFPKAEILLCWLDGNKNAADTMSKLHYDNVSILNSKLYRNGPEELFKECEDRVVFYRFTEGKEEWIPLPEKLIMRARKPNQAKPLQTTKSQKTS